MKLFLYIKLLYLDIQLKYLNRKVNKLRDKYKQKYLDL